MLSFADRRSAPSANDEAMPEESIGSRFRGANGVRGGLDELGRTRAVDHEYQPRTGAQLADAGHHRGDEAGAEFLAAVGERAGQNEDRVDARHLRIDRDRNRAGGGGRGQRDSGLPGSGEPDRADVGIGDQRDAGRPAGPEQEREGALWQVVGLDRRPDGAADQFRGPGMGRVRLDDHRGPGGKGRGGVAAGDREGEREVTGREHGDRAERDLALAQVGFGQRATVGIRGVQAGAGPAAFPHHVGEEPQLAGGAGQFALHSRHRDTGFGVDPVDKHGAEVFQLVGDRLEECGALLEAGVPVAQERLPGQLRGAGDRRVVGLVVDGFQSFAGGRVDGLKWCRAAGHVVRADQGGSGGFDGVCGAHAAASQARTRSAPCAASLAHARLTFFTRMASSATSASSRSVSGQRTGPAGRPMTFMPALMMLTA